MHALFYRNNYEETKEGVYTNYISEKIYINDKRQVILYKLNGFFPPSKL